MANLWLTSPAKINLFLHIVGQRADGYHLLETAFQFIDLCDEIGFELREDGKIQLTAEDLNFPAEENLIVKAAKLLQDDTGCRLGADIFLKKRIPIGAGLGGGSSNAATTLLALDKLWQTNLTQNELLQLGLRLGADVPIFIYGKSAFAQGIGEIFQPISPTEDWILLLIPPCHVETRKIFSDSQLTRNTPAIKIRECFENGGHNDCEPIARKYFPDIANTLDLLRQYSDARMTGTGSGVFATFNSKEAAIEVAEKMPALLNAIIVKRLNTSPLFNFQNK